ncbi:MAG: virulence factor [Anaerolineae bacterium]|nr:virulence factor [Anaerolineae bacterium]
MARYEILYWHDIPVQVRAGGRRDRVSEELPTRFLDAVDRAALATKLTGTDGYLSQFRWSEPEERAGSPAAVVAAIIAELDAAFPEIDWRATAERIKGAREG